MSGRGLNVFVQIGAKVGSSLGSAARATEARFEQMGRRLKLVGAETKATLAGIEAAQSRHRGAVVDGLAGMYLGSRIIKPFVTFEDRLVRLGNTAQVHGPKLDRIGRDVIAVGARFGFGGAAAAEGVGDFVAAGLDLETSLKALAPTLKLSKTVGIDPLEASQAGISVLQNLGVEVTKLGAAFDVMAVAGKEGRFEANEMAKAFPGLASRAKLLGMAGVNGVARIASMLQPIRQGARDADEAANNLLNFFDKLTGKETSDYFSKFGVNIESVFNQSKRTGTDFVDNMLDQLDRLSAGGTNGFVLSKLFPDRQARQAALLLLQNRKEVERIRRLALTSPGVLDGDFARVSRTAKFGLDRFGAGLERIGIALGRSFGPMLGDVAERFAGLAERFANWADKHPALVKSIGTIAAGMVGLRVATAAVGLAFGGIFTGAARLVGGLKSIGQFVAPLAARLVPLRVAMVGARYGIMAALAVSAPFAASLLAIGTAVAFVVAKWNGIKAFFTGFGSAFCKALTPETRANFAKIGGLFFSLTGALRPVLGLFGGLAGAIGTVFGWLGKLLAPAEAGRWRSWGEGAGGAIGTVAKALGGLIGKVDGAIRKLSELTSIKIAPDSGIGAMLRGAGRGFVTGGIAGAITGAGSEAGLRLAGKRASGGSVTAGKPYLIGERGAEIMVPGRSGTVVPAHVLSALRQIGARQTANENGRGRGRQAAAMFFGVLGPAMVPMPAAAAPPIKFAPPAINFPAPPSSALKAPLAVPAVHSIDAAVSPVHERAPVAGVSPVLPQGSASAGASITTAGRQAEITINVNVTGASEPQMTAAAVRRMLHEELRKLADQQAGLYGD